MLLDKMAKALASYDYYLVTSLSFANTLSALLPPPHWTQVFWCSSCERTLSCSKFYSTAGKEGSHNMPNAFILSTFSVAR